MENDVRNGPLFQLAEEELQEFSGIASHSDLKTCPAMIEDARAVPVGKVFQCDLCIVGGGPAGISIAKELAGSSSSVILIEAGGRKETAQARDLYRGYAEPESSHEPLEENR